VLRAVCAGPEHVGWGLGDLDRQLARGELLGEILVQRHPTVLWAKEWDRYVVVGIPDGIGEDFVYEFKSTRMSYGGLRKIMYCPSQGRRRTSTRGSLSDKGGSSRYSHVKT